MVVKVWDKASKNFAIKAVNKGGQYKAVAQEGRLRMAFTVTALFADIFVDVDRRVLGYLKGRGNKLSALMEMVHLRPAEN